VPHLAIAGAGLAGRLLAWRMLHAGFEVSLFDQDTSDGHASSGWIAAAMLAPCSEAVTSEELIFHLGCASMERWPSWLAQLRRDSGQAIFFQIRGSIVVAHHQDQSELQRFHSHLQALDFIPQAQVRHLDHQGLKQLEPQLAEHFQQGLLLANEGYLSNRELYPALHQAILRLGGKWHERTPVEAVQPGLIVADGQRHHCDVSADCRGLGSGSSGLRAVRGEVLRVLAPEVRLSRPVRLMHPRYRLYISPRPGGRYIIGATEIESDSLEPMSLRSALELLSGLYSLHSGFAEARLEECAAGLRPAFWDNLPRLELEDGRLSLNGLYRHGYLIGPATVEAATQLLCGQALAADLPLKWIHDRRTVATAHAS